MALFIERLQKKFLFFLGSMNDIDASIKQRNDMNNYEIQTIILQVMPGANIGSLIRDAITLSQKMFADIEFTFNGTKVAITRGETDVEKIYSRWSNAYNETTPKPKSTGATTPNAELSISDAYRELKTNGHPKTILFVETFIAGMNDMDKDKIPYSSELKFSEDGIACTISITKRRDR